MEVIKKWLFITFLIFLAILINYLFVDKIAVVWCHEHLTDNDKKIFQIITGFGNLIYYLIVLGGAFLLFRFLWKKPLWAEDILILLVSVSLSGIVTQIFKWIAGRYRPSELFDQGLYGFDFFHISQAMTSFPSGHAATAFALATALTYLWPKMGIPIWLFAFLIGISRLIVGAHYPSDIIAGAFVGTFTTSLLIRYWPIQK